MLSESMIEHLKALAAKFSRRLRGGMPPFFDDPLVGVREPRPRPPGGRNLAAAVDEPRDVPERTAAVGLIDRSTH